MNFVKKWITETQEKQETALFFSYTILKMHIFFQQAGNFSSFQLVKQEGGTDQGYYCTF